MLILQLGPDPVCCCCFGDLCKAPTVYDIDSQTQVYLAKDIRQISQIYASKAMCCCCCCLDYAGGIEISFGEYNHPSSQSATVRTGSNSYLYQKLAGLLANPVDFMEKVVGVTRKRNVLTVLSGTADDVFDGNVNAVLDDLATLHSVLIKLLPVPADIVIENENIRKGTFKTANDFKNVTVVDDKGNIEIPGKWLPLMVGERIINCNGQVYKMNCLDYFYTITTFGYYYCAYIHYKKFSRSALILTNKRIIDIEINQRAGQIPFHLANVGIQVRSLFPGNIKSGYFASYGKHHLEAGLETDGGEIFFDFYSGVESSGRDATEFVKALQMSTERADSNVQIERTTTSKNEINQKEMSVLPLLPSETFLGYVKGPNAFLPFCSDRCSLFCANSCVYPPVKNACSRDTLGCCFPWMPYLCSCGLRPFLSTNDIMVTNNSIISYTRIGNKGFCCQPGCCETKESFVVAWSPISRLRGHRVHTKYGGNETCCTRLFKETTIGEACCPIGRGYQQISIDLSYVDYVVTRQGVAANFNNDEDTVNVLLLLGRVESTIFKQTKENHGQVIVATAIDRV